MCSGSTALTRIGLGRSGHSAAPPASAVTPQLVEAAKKEGRVVYYTSIDLPVAERIAKAFEATYPGIAVRVERTGAERVFQRIGQEYASRIYSVDVVNSSDAAHFVVWKREGMLEPYVPEDVAKYYPAEHKDPDGTFASYRVWLCVIGYNNPGSKPRPRLQQNLLDPNDEDGRAHGLQRAPSCPRPIRWRRPLAAGLFRELAQKVMRTVVALIRRARSERAMMADGNDYNVFTERRRAL
jgi:iron(III) transport system substrate-binding protein